MWYARDHEERSFKSKNREEKTVMYSARLVDTGWMLHVRPGISYISLIQNSFVHRRGKEGPG